MTVKVVSDRETSSQVMAMRRHWRKLGGSLAYHPRYTADDVYEGARGTLMGDRVKAFDAQLVGRSYFGECTINAWMTPEEDLAAPLIGISIGTPYGVNSGWEKGSFEDGPRCLTCGGRTPRVLQPGARVQSRNRKLDAFDSWGVAVSSRLADAIRHFPGVVLQTMPADPDFLFLDCDRWLKVPLDPLATPCQVCGVTSFPRISGLMVYPRLNAAPPSGLYVADRLKSSLIVAPDLLAVLQDKRWRIREQRLLGGVWLDTHPFDTDWPLPDLVYVTPDFSAWFDVPGAIEVPPGPAEVLLPGGVRMPADLDALAPYAISADEAIARCRAAERGENPHLRARLEALNPDTPELDDALATPQGRAALLQIAADLARELDEQEAWFRDNYTDPAPTPPRR